MSLNLAVWGIYGLAVVSDCEQQEKGLFKRRQRKRIRVLPNKAVLTVSPTDDDNIERLDVAIDAIIERAMDRKTPLGEVLPILKREFGKLPDRYVASFLCIGYEGPTMAGPTVSYLDLKNPEDPAAMKPVRVQSGIAWVGDGLAVCGSFADAIDARARDEYATNLICRFPGEELKLPHVLPLKDGETMMIACDMEALKRLAGIMIAYTRYLWDYRCGAEGIEEDTCGMAVTAEKTKAFDFR